MLILPEVPEALVLRTDFSDDAWEVPGPSLANMDFFEFTDTSIRRRLRGCRQPSVRHP